MSTIAENAQIIDQEFNWLQIIIESRINNFINRDDPNFTEQDANLPAPDISQLSTYYSDFQKHSLTSDEREIILLALAPEIQPEMPDVF